MVKKGQGNLIVTILIILLCIAAFAIVYVIVINVIKNNSQKINFNSIILSGDLKYSLSSDNKTVYLVVTRASDKASVSGVKFIFEDRDGNFYMYNSSIYPEILESKEYIVTPDLLSPKLDNFSKLHFVQFYFLYLDSKGTIQTYEKIIDKTTASPLTFVLAGGNCTNCTSNDNFTNYIQVSNCTNINSPGNYILVNNVSSNGTCFNINSDNVLFNGNGKRISFNFQNINSTFGINLSRTLTNITIMNFDIIDFGNGAGFDHAGIKVNYDLYNSSIIKNYIYSKEMNGFYYNIIEDKQYPTSGAIVIMGELNDSNILNNFLISSNQNYGEVLNPPNSYYSSYQGVSIAFESSVNFCNISNNYIFSSSRAGIYVNDYSISNNFFNNSIFSDDIAMDISRCFYNNFYNNYLNFSSSPGIYCSFGSYSVFSNNFVTSIGIYTSDHNKILNNNFYYPFIIYTRSYSDSDIIFNNSQIQSFSWLDGFSYSRSFNLSIVDQVIRQYEFNSLSYVSLSNKTHGIIDFYGGIKTSGSNLIGLNDSDIRIGKNTVYINDGKSGLNKSANITLFNTGVNSATKIYRNGVLCGNCSNLYDLGGTNYSFIISSAGNYSVGI